MEERYATVHYWLECPHGCLIPIPNPTQVEISSNPPATATDEPSAIVACPECGLVSLYSERDILRRAAGKPDPFEAGICHLAAIKVECDDRDCGVLTVVRTTLGSDKGLWTEKAKPIDWKFSPDCKCENGHRLIASWEGKKIAWEDARLPFRFLRR